MKRFKGIKQRWIINSFLPAISILILSVLIFCITTVNYYYNTMLSQLSNKAETTADFFNKYLTSATEFYTTAKNFTIEFVDKKNIEMQTVSLNGNIIYSSSGIVSGYRPGTPDVDNAIRDAETHTYMGVDELTGEKVLSVSTPLFYGNGSLGGIFRLVTSMQKVNQFLTYMSLIAVAVAVVIFLLISWTNRYFLRSIVNPIKEINDMARKIAAGNYGEKIANPYNDEIGELAETINYMSAEIARTDKTKNDFISSVSHELRTPLTAIKGWAETLDDSGISDDEITKKGLTIIIKEANSLNNMLSELLDFSRMQSGRMIINFGQVNVGDEIEDVTATFGETLKQDDFIIRYKDKLGELWITADRTRLRQVFVNIIDNARKYASEGKYLDITLEKNFFREGNPCVMITFRDYGEGISASDLPHVTEKFYKGRTRKPGSGIGLAVANEIVMLHDGSLLIKNADEGTGTVIIIKLPLKQETNTEEGAGYGK